MPSPPDHLGSVVEVIEELRDLGFDPVLIGGMALVVLGSRRVTRDFDFVVDLPGGRVPSLARVFYSRGMELASKIDKSGNVTATIDTLKVAEIRLRLDAPVSATFVNMKTALRIDLLFDFPLPAAGLARTATRKTVRGHQLAIATREDLLKLKRIAARKRHVPSDRDDIRFLEQLPPEDT